MNPGRDAVQAIADEGQGLEDAGAARRRDNARPTEQPIDIADDLNTWLAGRGLGARVPAGTQMIEQIWASEGLPRAVSRVQALRLRGRVLTSSAKSRRTRPGQVDT